MKKSLLFLLCTINIYHAVAQTCTATITAGGPTSFCTGGSVVLNANTGNAWTQKADYGGNARNAYNGFSIGNKGYIGIGYDGSSYKKDFWSYDPANNTWTQKADFGGTGRRYAASFSVGGKGYIGTGYDGTSYKKDFWEYDTTSNTWTQRKDFGGVARDLSTGFSIGSKGYIGTGNDGSFKKDFWEYNPANDTWTQKSDFGGTGRNGATSFSIGAKGYICLGTDGSYKKDVWEYDNSANAWTQKTDFGGTARNTATSFSIGSKGFVGMGFDNSFKKDFWEFDPIANTWTQRADFGGTARNAATCFSIGSYGFIGLGYDGTYKKDFWQYDPAKTYLWSNNAATSFITATTNGSYTVTVTNITGCSITSVPTVVTVSSSESITSATAATNPLCIGSTTTLTANGVSGSNTTVTWWTGTGGTGTNLGTGLTLPNSGPGTYYARVTGSCGSPAEAVVTVTTQADVAISTATATNSPICPSATTTLSANGVSGTNAIVNWWTGIGGTGTNVGTGVSLPNIPPGTYYARVTGNCGSPAEAIVTVDSKVNVGISSATAAASPICNNATTTLTANNVTGTNATINWWTGTGGTGTNAGSGTTLPNAAPVTYYAYVTGDCGSPAEAVVTVVPKVNVGIISATAATNPICSNTTTSITANSISGTNALLNWWTGTGGTGMNLGTATTLLNQPPGIYYAYVTGDCGLPAEAVVTVGSKSPTTSTTTASNCGSYTWNKVIYKTSGTYTYQTTNAVGCDSTATLNLTIFSTISNAYTKKDVACSTVASGSIIVTPTIGNAPFSYRLGTTGTPQTSNVFAGLRAGTYRIYITDKNGCTGSTASITILQQTTITGTFTKKDATCFGYANGSITITPTSGTSPFTYQFGTSGTYGSSNTQTNLIAGDYRVYMQDANACTVVIAPITIAQSPQVNATVTKTNISCYGLNDGKINVTNVIGVAPYKYKLNFIGTYVAFTPPLSLTGLKAGGYHIYIKDSGGCEGATDTLNILQAPTINATFANVNASCNGSADGSITVGNPLNGVSPYQYRLGTTGNYSAANVFPALKAANYIIAIKDSVGCAINLRDTLRQPDKIVASFTKVDASCPLAKDGSITLTTVGGTAPYQYRIGTTGSYVSTNTFPGLGAGSYRIYVKDTINCAGASVVVTIGQKSTTCTSTFAKLIRTQMATFSVDVSPNPSSSNFSIIVHSSSIQPVSIRMMDANGKTVYEVKGSAQQSFSFGERLTNGLYLAEVRQGNEVKTIKMVKAK